MTSVITIVTIVALLSFALSIILMVHYMPQHLSTQHPVARHPQFRRQSPAQPHAQQPPGQSKGRKNFCAPWPQCALPPRAPKYFELCSLLKAWRPENASREASHGSPAIGTFQEGKERALPVFNFSDSQERAIAQQWRDAELPFLLVAVPEVDETVIRWTDEFLRRGFASMRSSSYHVERSTGRTGHFLYYRKNKGYADMQAMGRHNRRNDRGREGETSSEHRWRPPESDAHLDYLAFERAASAADKEQGGRSDQVYYLTVSSGVGGATSWISESLSMFRDVDFFRPAGMTSRFHGINCRLGMRGAIQASHYDHGRNFIALARGAKRYLIQPPEVCPDLMLLGKNHPSGRHSSFDWASAEETYAYNGSSGGTAISTSEREIVQARVAQRRKFCATAATEIVLTAGELLYLPSYWFHYIVSLERNVQCNSRSGNDPRRHVEKMMQKCMTDSTLKTPLGGW